MAADNRTLARFMLEGIPPSPRGVPQVEVVFDIDANGILSVTAKDKASGKSQSVRIEASTSLSKEEIEKLKKEAAEHASEDASRRELAETRNQAEQTIYLAEKAVKDAGDKIGEDVRSAVSAKIEALKKVKDEGGLEEVKSALAELSAEIQKIGQTMYNKKDDAGNPESADHPKPD